MLYHTFVFKHQLIRMDTNPTTRQHELIKNFMASLPAHIEEVRILRLRSVSTGEQSCVLRSARDPFCCQLSDETYHALCVVEPAIAEAAATYVPVTLAAVYSYLRRCKLLLLL